MSTSTQVVATYNSPVEANIARTRLEEHGIDCRLDDANILASHPLLGSAVGGIKLIVRKEDAEAAAEVLAGAVGEDEVSLMDIDWDAEEEDDDRLVASGLSCPKCASEDIGFGSIFHGYWALVILVSFGPIFIPRTPATAWLVDYHLVALPAGIFIGLWLAIFRLFPLACKNCDTQGMRKVFQGNRVE